MWWYTFKFIVCLKHWKRSHKEYNVKKNISFAEIKLNVCFWMTTHTSENLQFWYPEAWTAIGSLRKRQLWGNIQIAVLSLQGPWDPNGRKWVCGLESLKWAIKWAPSPQQQCLGNYCNLLQWDFSMSYHDNFFLNLTITSQNFTKIAILSYLKCQSRWCEQNLSRLCFIDFELWGGDTNYGKVIYVYMHDTSKQ